MATLNKRSSVSQVSKLCVSVCEEEMGKVTFNYSLATLKYSYEGLYELVYNFYYTMYYNLIVPISCGLVLLIWTQRCHQQLTLSAIVVFRFGLKSNIIEEW